MGERALGTFLWLSVVLLSAALLSAGCAAVPPAADVAEEPVTVLSEPAPAVEEEVFDQINWVEAELDNKDADPEALRLAEPRQMAGRSGPVATPRETAQKQDSKPVPPTPTAKVEPPPPPAPEPPPPPAPAPAGPARTYTSHTVVRGDTFWNIAIQYGIPMPELLAANGMNERTPLNVGMTLKVPVWQIPVKETPGPEFGELLDWWTEAQYVWPIGRDARIIDFQTGRSFMARRTVGAFHADVEPLTAEDSRIMREIWGGFSWATRPVIVEVDGRRLAASANGMPHSIQTITNNNFNGHFCIHFQNSTRHKDNRQQADHQQNVRTAAGVR